MLDPWIDNPNPNISSNPNDSTGGGYSSGYNFINPATGQVDPTYRPPAGTTDRFGQTGAPSGGKAGGGAPGGAGVPGGSGNSIVDSYMGTGAAPATTAATVAAPAAAGTYLGMTVPQWLQSALALYGAYKGSQPGKFQQIPEDPSQTAARQKLLGYVDKSPTRDLLGNLIGQRLGAAHPFELPKSPTGYNPFPSGNAPSYDLSAILPMLAPHAGATSAPASTGTSPVADSVGQWLTAHPEVLQMGVNVAAGAVAAQFRIPQDQALQIVSAHVQGQQAAPTQTPAMIGATP